MSVLSKNRYFYVAWGVAILDFYRFLAFLSILALISCNLETNLVSFANDLLSEILRTP